MRVLGVDACNGGWLGVELDNGSFVSAYTRPTLADLVGQAPEARVVAVDMPLGLLEHGWRDADLTAVAVLGPRRSSLFRIPPRAVWEEQDYPTANQRCRRLTGGGLSRQAWGLRVKLLEANAFWRNHTDLVYEVHPEVSFRHLAGEPLAHPKRTWNGLALRRDLLRRHGVAIPDDVGDVGRAALDDALDAAAAAWSAHRIGTGNAISYPDPPQLSATGDKVAICA